VIRVFIDGPIAGDVRTDFPASLGPRVRVPIPRQITTCDCNPYELPSEHEWGPEIVEYHAIASGAQLAIMSTSAERDDQALARLMDSWVRSDLSSALWQRHCQDRNAWR
jgi:hypothetical protein